MRVVTSAYAAGTNVVRFATSEVLGSFDLPRQSFQGFHDRAVIGRVNDGAGGVGDEVQTNGRRAFAVEFGEERKHAAAELRIGES